MRIRSTVSIFGIAPAALVVLALAVTVSAESVQFVKVRDFRKGELYCKGFEVKKPTSIHISAIGAASSNDQYLSAYAWIIPAGNLEPVWIMDDSNTDEAEADDRLREYDRNLELEPGQYQVYYYAGPVNSWDGVNFSLDWDQFKQALEDVKKELGNKAEDLAKLEKQLKENNWNVTIDSDWSHEMEELLAEYRLEISGDNNDIRSTTCSFTSDRVIAEILHPDHEQYTSVGFSLAKPMDIEVQCIGEIPDWSDSYADYGWIVNADTRKREWSMSDEHLRWAGGGEKNKMARRTFRLDKGNYLLYYVTDDSHGYDDWNCPPPYNPEAYGVRVTAVAKSDLASVSTYRETTSQMALLSIVRAGDDFMEVKPFRVKQDCDVRVYALGEYSSGSGDFADYAWIERLGDSRPFWLMQERNTESAGGAKKNRLADEVVTLPKGDYVLGYVTDDSHAYGAWNAGAPYDQKNYGVTLFAANSSFDRSLISELQEEAESKDVLARIVRVGDDADETTSFTLDKPTRVHVVAMGEGSDDDMYDYGWIENLQTRDIVWEMTYRKTSSAGGADKNRIADTQIYLDAGTYRLHYVSDGSHSFGNWNATKPRNPQYWGISVMRAE
ncbi:MAG: hypothetical protein IPH59_15375 [bacterium]|nr:hypothetical protein [bacterium]